MKRIFFVIVVTLSILTGSAVAEDKSMVGPYSVEKTANGVPVYFFKSQNLPLFQIELAYKVGSDFDPDKKSGLSMFTFSMLKRGVRGIDENKITEKLDALAGGIEFSSDQEYSFVSAYGLNDHVDQILDLLFKILQEHTFPKAAFNRIRSNHLDSFKQLLDDPVSLVDHVYAQALYNGTFRARPPSGLKKDVEGLSLTDLQRFSPVLLNTKNLQVLVVGGKSESEILSKVKKRVEGLSSSKDESLSLKTYFDPLKKIDPLKIAIIHRPELSEAHLRMGFLGPSRKDPDIYDLRLVETVLSGTFSSRLNQIIREKLNLSYSVDAHFDFDESIGDFTVSSSTRNEKLPELVLRLREILKDLTKPGSISESELSMAKDYLIGSFPLGFNNVFSLASTFFHGQLLGLKPNFLDEYIDKVTDVNSSSIQRAIQRHFHLDQMITVVVGDESKLGELLKKSGLGYVVINPTDFL